MKARRDHRKPLSLALIAALVVTQVFAVAPARAQNLDDDIDAELDDTLKVDDGEKSAAAKPSTETPPEAPPKSAAESPVESGTAESEQAKTADENLDLDEPQNQAEESKVVEKTPDEPVANEAPAEPVAGATPRSIEEEDALDEQPATAQAKPEEAPTAVDSGEDLEQAEVKLAPTPEPVSKVAEPQPAQSNATDDERMAKNKQILFDSPNQKTEERFSNYSRSYKPVGVQRWEEVVGQRRAEHYNVQTGDTLWDISETFFGDGFFWAKLWSQNTKIENPHMILKGKALRFVAGTEADAPVIDMTKAVAVNSESVGITDLPGAKPVFREQAEKEISKEELESGTAVEMDELVPQPEIPPPSFPSRPPNELPPSFRFPQLYEDQKNYDAAGFSGTPLTKALTTPAQLIANSYVVENISLAVGRVVETERLSPFGAEGQIVFVKMSRQAGVGERYTVIKQSREIGQAKVVDILAVLEIEGATNEEKNLYRARIVSSISPVEPGANLIADVPPIADFKRTQRIGTTRAKVIGGDHFDDRKLLCEGTLIYLNAGMNQGINVGDMFGIEANRSLRDDDTKVPDQEKSIAAIKVIHADRRASTALVLSCSDAVMIGDHTTSRMPELMTELRTETTQDIMGSQFGNSGR